MYTHLALEDMEDKEILRKNLEKTIAEATRCKDVVKGLFDAYSSLDHDLSPRSVTVSELIRRLQQRFPAEFEDIGFVLKRDLRVRLPAVHPSAMLRANGWDFFGGDQPNSRSYREYKPPSGPPIAMRKNRSKKSVFCFFMRPFAQNDACLIVTLLGFVKQCPIFEPAI